MFTKPVLTGFSTCFLFFSFLNAESERIEEMQGLYQRAEYAMRMQDYQTAKEAYRSLLSYNMAPEQDICSYADCVIRLGKAEMELGFFHDAEQQLKKLLKRPLPPDLQLRATVTLSQIMQRQNLQNEAYSILEKAKEHSNFERWSLEDKVYFLTLEEILSP
jgi:tetratricopeptide (TPR) repeat protein